MTNSNAFDVDEVEVVEAFRDAFGRMFTRGGEDWLNAIPTDAHLTLGDVRRIKQGETIRVLEPQRYQSIVMLSSDHMMFESDSAYGYFYGQDGDSFVDTPSLKTLDERDDHYLAVSGSGAEHWYKITESLKRHARNWE